MFATLEEQTTSVLTLTEGLEAEEFLRSRLTRLEVRRQLLVIAETLQRIGSDGQSRWPELDWEAWSTTAARIESRDAQEDDALWFAVRALTPATLTWLRLYRSRQPSVSAVQEERCKATSRA